MPISNTSVVVIIPVYNRPELLFETMEAIFRQKGSFKITVVVVDDNSPEHIDRLVKMRYPQVKVIRNKINLRSGPARNEAFRYIQKSDYVAFLDYDDVWHPDFLTSSITALQKGDFIGSLAMSRPNFETSFKLVAKYKILLLSVIRDCLQLFFYLFNKKTIPQSAFYLCQLSHLVFKRELIEDLWFDPAYNFGGEDWKFMLEVMDRGQVTIIPKRLVKYRYHPASSTFIPINLQRKWNSYRQLFAELDKRRIGGLMRGLFSAYICTFSQA